MRLIVLFMIFQFFSLARIATVLQVYIRYNRARQEENPQTVHPLRVVYQSIASRLGLEVKLQSSSQAERKMQPGKIDLF